jgi:hypothetical protein
MTRKLDVEVALDFVPGTFVPNSSYGKREVTSFPNNQAARISGYIDCISNLLLEVHQGEMEDVWCPRLKDDDFQGGFTRVQGKGRGKDATWAGLYLPLQVLQPETQLSRLAMGQHGWARTSED